MLDRVARGTWAIRYGNLRYLPRALTRANHVSLLPLIMIMLNLRCPAARPVGELLGGRDRERAAPEP